MKNNTLVLGLILNMLFLVTPLRADLIDSLEELESDRTPKVETKKEEPKPSPIPSPQTVTKDSKIDEALPPPTTVRTKDTSSSRPDNSPSPAKSPNTQKGPVKFRSDGKLTYSRMGGMIHMQQNVVITQDDLRFQSDEAKVWINEASGDNEVERVECKGQVRVAKFAEDANEKITARGDEAFFFNKEQKIILKGDARLWRGGHLIKGEQITYTLEDGMITVDRAEGVVQPEAKKSNQ